MSLTTLEPSDLPPPPPLGYEILPSEVSDLGSLEAIEKAASQMLVEQGIPSSELESGVAIHRFEQARRSGLLWVARTDGGTPVGFALVELAGSQPHLAELDVHPDHARKGLGRALVSTAWWSLLRAGFAQLSLTTYRDIPWNAPFYSRLGFQEVSEDVLSDALAEIVDDEMRAGLDVERRVVMVLLESHAPTSLSIPATGADAGDEAEGEDSVGATALPDGASYRQ